MAQQAPTRVTRFLSCAEEDEDGNEEEEEEEDEDMDDSEEDALANEPRRPRLRMRF